jgi:hypothetical protein
MEDLLWSVFKKSGKIDAFLAYKDYQRSARDVESTVEDCENE